MPHRLPPHPSELAAFGAAPLLIAYSGGGDSTALLMAACARGPTHAAIIDHAIQPASAAMAARAAAIAKDLGVQVSRRRLTWPGPDAPRDQARARRARYAALAEIALAGGYDRVLTGHTQDDQDETVLIRWAARSGRRGLAGMAPACPYPLWPVGRGITLHRPSLFISRQDLRDRLTASRLDWLEDPANANLTFARVRARQVLELDSGLRQRLRGLAAQAAGRAGRIDGLALAVASATVQFDAFGRAALSQAGFAQAEPVVRARLLEILLMAVSGAESAAETPKLWEAAARLTQPGRQAGTLGGAAFAVKDGHLLLSVDPGRAIGRRGVPPPPAPLTGPLAWQGRILIHPAEGAPPVEVAAPPAAIGKSGDPHLPWIQASGHEFPLEAALARGLIQSWRALAEERLQLLLYRAAFTRP